MSGKVVILGGRGNSTAYVANALASRVNLAAIILEDPVSRAKRLKWRVSRLGLATALGQLLFMMLILPILKARGEVRRRELEREYGLNSSLPPDVPVHNVPSVNDETVKELLAALAPDLVVVNGTRIISTATLAISDAPFINTHVGITPAFRGVHGGYWALARGQEDKFGTTIHLVDAGVDTGVVLAQATGRPEPTDNFTTYPVLQYGLIIEKLVGVAVCMANGDRPTTVLPLSTDSTQYYHPTLWSYLWTRVVKGVK